MEKKVNSTLKTNLNQDQKRNPSWFKKGYIPWNKGKKCSENTKEKIRMAHLGKSYPITGGWKWSKEAKERKSETRKGKRHTEETKKKIRDAQSGSKGYWWQGGKSFEPYSPEFNEELREKIRDRDNRKCRECGYTEDRLGYKYKLSVHHIDYDKKNNNPENLISLCNTCHAQTNFNQKDWTKYFGEKLNEQKQSDI